ncbi:TetR/AcrR family transcriptional regulator C-terminal domain-containing protein [Bradyrhizobium sp. 5.13L]
MTHPATKPMREESTGARPELCDEVVLAVSEVLARACDAPADLDGILDRAGLSKEEVLRAFQSSDNLIVAIAEHKATLISQPLVTRARPSTIEDARETLNEFGRVAWKEYSTTLVGFIRMLMTEGASNPALKRRVHAAGQLAVIIELRKFLSTASERGILSVTDAQLYAEQLLGMLREPLYQTLMLSPAPRLERATADRVAASIESFIDGCSSSRNIIR